MIFKVVSVEVALGIILKKLEVFFFFICGKMESCLGTFRVIMIQITDWCRDTEKPQNQT